MSSCVKRIIACGEASLAAVFFAEVRLRVAGAAGADFAVVAVVEADARAVRVDFRRGLAAGAFACDCVFLVPADFDLAIGLVLSC